MGEQFDEAVQQTVEDRINPVRFGLVQKVIFAVVFVLAAVSATASVLTLFLTW